MYQSTGQWFGWKIESAHDHTHGIEQVTVQLTAKVNEEWVNVGPRFPATHLDDLLHSLQKAHHLLQDKFVKDEKGWKPRNLFF